MIFGVFWESKCKMLILRVEHSESRRGPYNHFIRYNPKYAITDILLDMNIDVYYHPSPFEEFGRYPNETELFGFLSEGQFENWFPKPSWPVLERHGFVLSGILSDDVTAGRSQVIVKRERFRRAFSAITMASGLMAYRALATSEGS